MPLNYYGSNAGDIEAAGNIGATAGGIAFAHPLLQANASRYRQQLALMKAQEILRDMQAQEVQKRTELLGEQIKGQQGKNVNAQNMQKALGDLGQARSSQYLLNLQPDTSVDPHLAVERAMATAAAIRNAFMVTGANPQRGEAFANRNIADVAQQNNAALQPFIATNTKITPMQVAPNRTVFDPVSQQQIGQGNMLVNPGQTLANSQGQPMLQGQQRQLPQHNPAVSSLAAAAFRVMTTGATQQQRAMGKAVWDQVSPIVLQQQQPQQAQQPTTNNVPPVGFESKGYRFKGGDPSQQANWEKVQ